MQKLLFLPQSTFKIKIRDCTVDKLWSSKPKFSKYKTIIRFRLLKFQLLHQVVHNHFFLL